MSQLQHPVSGIEIQLETTLGTVFFPVISAELRGFSRYLAKMDSFVTLGCKCFVAAGMCRVEAGLEGARTQLFCRSSLKSHSFSTLARPFSAVNY